MERSSDQKKTRTGFGSPHCVRSTCGLKRETESRAEQVESCCSSTVLTSSLPILSLLLRRPHTSTLHFSSLELPSLGLQSLFRHSTIHPLPFVILPCPGLPLLCLLSPLLLPPPRVAGLRRDSTPTPTLRHFDILHHKLPHPSFSPTLSPLDIHIPPPTEDAKPLRIGWQCGRGLRARLGSGCGG